MPTKKVDREKLAELSATNMTDEEIAKVLGCKPGSVRTIRWFNGIKRTARPRNALSARADEIVERFRSGVSIGDLATAYTLKESTVRSILARRGIVLAVHRVDHDAIAKLHGEGLSMGEIATRLGYAYSSVHRSLKTHNNA